MDWYPWLKTLHILFAIVAVGVNISYGSLAGACDAGV